MTTLIFFITFLALLILFIRFIFKTIRRKPVAKTMKIIGAIGGNRLKLTKTRLTQIDHPATVYPFHVTKDQLKRALSSYFRAGRQRVDVTGRDAEGRPSTVPVTFKQPGLGYIFPIKPRIGCTTFDEKTYRLILKTMGLVEG